MRTALKLCLSLAVVVGVMALARARDEVGDSKEQTLKGTITCAKCDLKINKNKCATVIKVKDTVYWFDKIADKKYHKKVCTEGQDGTVTGVVSEMDGKKIIKVSKVQFAD
jgi:hypothetical protein